MSDLITFFLDLTPYTMQLLNDITISPKYKKIILAGKILMSTYMLVDMMNLIFIQKQQYYIDNIYLKALSYILTFLMVCYHFYVECKKEKK